jgi:uncharacterized hydrophobic protein (TIGR00341 family)
LKKLEVTVTGEDADRIRQVLEDAELQYTFCDVKGQERQVRVFSALLPDALVDQIIEDISKSMDLRVRENTLSTYPVETHVSTFLDRLNERISKETPSPHNPLEQLVNATDRYTRPQLDLFLMVFFASIVALAGLLLDNVALVIGGMLVSPLLGPINSFSVNANLGRIKKLATSELSIVSLLIAVMLLSALLTFIISKIAVLNVNTGQVLIREHASLVDVGIAIVLGFAGGLALFAAIPEILVGVTIAVAMVPPAAVAGIGLAQLNLELFAGALVLTFVYLIGLELGSTIMLRARGVTPRRYYEKSKSHIKFIYSISILATLLAVLAIIVTLT